MREVAAGAGDALREFDFDAAAGELLRDLNRASGVAKDLDGFDARDVVEEPAAAREHEHGVALHLEQLQDECSGGLQAAVRRAKARRHTGLQAAVRRAKARRHTVFTDEPFHIFFRPIEDHVDVVVSCRPRIAKQMLACFLENRRALIAKPLESFA